MAPLYPKVLSTACHTISCPPMPFLQVFRHNHTCIPSPCLLSILIKCVQFFTQALLCLSSECLVYLAALWTIQPIYCLPSLLRRPVLITPDWPYSPLCSTIRHPFFSKSIRMFYCTYLLHFTSPGPYSPPPTYYHTHPPKTPKTKNRAMSCLSARILPYLPLYSKDLSHLSGHSRCSVNIC